MKSDRFEFRCSGWASETRQLPAEAPCVLANLPQFPLVSLKHLLICPADLPPRSKPPILLLELFYFIICSLNRICWAEPRCECYFWYVRQAGMDATMDQLDSYFPQDLVQSWSGSGFRWMLMLLRISVNTFTSWWNDVHRLEIIKSEFIWLWDSEVFFFVF